MLVGAIGLALRAQILLTELRLSLRTGAVVPKDDAAKLLVGVKRSSSLVDSGELGDPGSESLGLV
jgi:hypothetical protein